MTFFSSLSTYGQVDHVGRLEHDKVIHNLLQTHLRLISNDSIRLCLLVELFVTS